MLVRFIVDSSDFLKVLSGREHEYFTVLRRNNGFFKNREVMRAHSVKVAEGMYEADPDDDIVIYTDDETMLNYAPYVSGDYMVEIKFPECDYFIPLRRIHPNLRRVNNLTIMFQKGIFHRDFSKWQQEFDIACQNGNMAPSEKQLLFIESICEMLELDDPKCQTKAEAHEWIGKHIDDYNKATKEIIEGFGLSMFDTF